MCVNASAGDSEVRVIWSKNEAKMGVFCCCRGSGLDVSNERVGGDVSGVKELGLFELCVLATCGTQVL